MDGIFCGCPFDVGPLTEGGWSQFGGAVAVQSEMEVTGGGAVGDDCNRE